MASRYAFALAAGSCTYALSASCSCGDAGEASVWGITEIASAGSGASDRRNAIDRAHRGRIGTAQIPTVCVAAAQCTPTRGRCVLLAGRKPIAYSTRRMRYEYTPEQLAWRDEVHAFCAAHVTDA